MINKRVGQRSHDKSSIYDTQARYTFELVNIPYKTHTRTDILNPRATRRRRHPKRSMNLSVQFSSRVCVCVCVCVIYYTLLHWCSVITMLISGTYTYVQHTVCVCMQALCGAYLSLVFGGSATSIKLWVLRGGQSVLSESRRRQDASVAWKDLGKLANLQLHYGKFLKFSKCAGNWTAMELEMEKEVLLKPPRGSVPDRGFSFKALKA